MKDVKSIPLLSTEYWNRAGDRHGLHGLVTTARRSRHTKSKQHKATTRTTKKRGKKVTNKKKRRNNSRLSWKFLETLYVVIV